MELLTKKVVIDFLIENIDNKIKDLQLSIKSLTDDRNSETKSSAGDKYETGRAMMEMELDKKKKQLSLNLKDKLLIKQFQRTETSNKIELGNLIVTENEYFFLGIGFGKLEINNTIIYAISSLSPIGQQLIGLKKGGVFSFLKKDCVVRHFE